MGNTFQRTVWCLFTRFTEIKKVLQNSKGKGNKADSVGPTSKPKEIQKDQKRKRRRSTEEERPEAAKKQGAVTEQQQLQEQHK
jgi:hypothetical protein